MEFCALGISSHDIDAAYRFILGREPDSAALANEFVSSFVDWKQLRLSLLSSEEGLLCLKNFEWMVGRGYYATPKEIETEVSKALFDELVSRTQQQWVRLGASDPYWSVLSAERWRLGCFRDEDLIDFYESGDKSARLIDSFEERAGLAAGRGVCVELGCGVGRITQALAREFEKVIAVDISPGNIRICEEYMKTHGLENVETLLLESIEDLNKLPEYDLFFSLIVLQHNSPPIQKKILDILLSRAKDDGACLFQTVTNIAGYSFSAAAYLDSPEVEIELHALPQSAVFEVFRKHNFSIQEVLSDPWIPEHGSHTFFAARQWCK